MISTLFHKNPSWAATLYSGKPPVCKRGKCDLQIAKSNNALEIDVKGSNEGSFQFRHVTKVEYARSSEDYDSIYAMAVADENLDGGPDLVVGNYRKPNQLLLNTGCGTFKEVLVGAFPDFINSTIRQHLLRYLLLTLMEIANINGDGLSDVITGNYGEQNNCLFVNKGNGIFRKKENAFPNNDTFKNTTGLAVADVNSNGILDLIVCNDGQPNQLF